MKKSLYKGLSKQAPGLTALLILTLIAITLVWFGPKNQTLMPATAHASSVNITGYAWSDNIGWISFSGTAADSSPYGVTVNSSTGALSGYAWSDNIGWINFGSNSCGAQATLAAGALSGWAQAPSTGGGWDGCISLSGASPAYGVTLSGSTFTGYAWGSDVVGWLSFSGTATDGSPYAVVYGGAGSPTCTLSVAPNPAATGSSITLNYTTTNSPTSGTLKDAGGATVYSGTVNSSGGIAATAPATAGSYTYTMSVTSTSGSGSCSTSPALNAQTDYCSDIAGIQNPAPPSPCTPPGQCVPSGYTWNGSQCVAVPPTILFSSLQSRVRAGSSATLQYTITNPPTSCSIVGKTATTTSFSANVSPSNGIQGSVSAQVYASTIFTMTCSGISQSTTVGIDPTYIEQ